MSTNRSSPIHSYGLESSHQFDLRGFRCKQDEEISRSLCYSSLFFSFSQNREDPNSCIELLVSFTIVHRGNTIVSRLLYTNFYVGLTILFVYVKSPSTWNPTKKYIEDVFTHFVFQPDSGLKCRLNDDEKWKMRACCLSTNLNVLSAVKLEMLCRMSDGAFIDIWKLPSKKVHKKALATICFNVSSFFFCLVVSSMQVLITRIRTARQPRENRFSPLIPAVNHPSIPSG